MLPALTIVNWFLAFVPIGIVLVTMMGLGWSGGKAGSLAWLATAAIALTTFGAPLNLVAAATMKGIWSTIYIIGIIWGAMLLFNLASQVKAFEVISAAFTRLTHGDRILQLLVIGWAFPSFLQGVLGFGAPVAVAAPLLVGLGFSPLIATAVTMLGHSWSVTFGSLGSSYAALEQMTGLSPQGLANWSALDLGLTCVMVGLSIPFLYEGWQGLKHGWRAVLVMGLPMAAALWLTASFGSPFVASLVAGIVGLVMGGVVVPRLSWYQPEDKQGGQEQAVPIEDEQLEAGQDDGGATRQVKGFHAAFFPYYVLIAIVLGIYLSPLKHWLGRLQVALSFPHQVTASGWIVNAVPHYAALGLLTTPGTLIGVTFIITYLFYRRRGLWRSGAGREVVVNSVTQATSSTMTLVTMSMTAVVMMDSGMVPLLAHGTAQMAGAAMPVIAPFVGVLGAFMTGSNTSSNILLGAFQRDVARELGLNALIIAAAQTTGGALGSTLAPMKIALGTGVTGIGGQEGQVIRKTIGYVVVMSLVIGVVTWILANQVQP